MTAQPKAKTVQVVLEIRRANDNVPLVNNLVCLKGRWNQPMKLLDGLDYNLTVAQRQDSRLPHTSVYNLLLSETGSPMEQGPMVRHLSQPWHTGILVRRIRSRAGAPDRPRHVRTVLPVAASYQTY